MAAQESITSSQILDSDSDDDIHYENDYVGRGDFSFSESSYTDGTYDESTADGSLSTSQQQQQPEDYPPQQQAAQRKTYPPQPKTYPVKQAPPPQKKYAQVSDDDEDDGTFGESTTDLDTTPSFEPQGYRQTYSASYEDDEDDDSSYTDDDDDTETYDESTTTDMDTNTTPSSEPKATNNNVRIAYQSARGGPDEDVAMIVEEEDTTESEEEEESASEDESSFEEESEEDTSSEEEEESTFDEDEAERLTRSPTSAMQAGEDQQVKKKNAVPESHFARVEALQELEINLQDVLEELRYERDSDTDLRHLVSQDDISTSSQTSRAMELPNKIIRGFENLLKVLLQVSNELELCSIFQNSKLETVVSEDALTSVLSYAPILEQVFIQLKPILQYYLHEREPSREEAEVLRRANLVLKLQGEVVYRVCCQKQEYTPRSEACFVTLVELLDRTATEMVCLYDGRPIPDYKLPNKLCRAWRAAGHADKLEPSFFAAKDMMTFRQMCFEVLVSTDDWCPNKRTLGRICNVSPPAPRDSPQDMDIDDLTPVPPMVLEVLEKIQGEPLPRTRTMASVLRRILPPEAVTDTDILAEYYDRQASQNHMGNHSVVAISSVPEVWNDSNSLGMGGVGKTTMAAMVAAHTDTRRYYSDGVAWVYVGTQEMNYAHYSQCLKDMCSQLPFCESSLLLPELVRIPGEAQSTRDRREEGFMCFARETVSALLEGKRVLIILDHVEFKSDANWFRFDKRSPSPGSAPRKNNSDFSTFGMIVITPCRDMLPAADTVEVDLLGEAEAIRLLVTESGQPPDHVMASSREAHSVVRVCAQHPLAVTCVGRWLSLKHATAGVITSVERIHEEVASAIDQIVERSDANQGGDTMYEILSMAFSPAVNGKPTLVIKFCFAAFVTVFCNEEHHSLFSPGGVQPIIPMALAELLFETLLESEEEKLFQEGSLFYSQRREATMLIPEALSALGVIKVISSSPDEDEDVETQGSSYDDSDQTLFLQVMHKSLLEYGEYLACEEEELLDLTNEAEKRWNRDFVNAYMTTASGWETDSLNASRDYAVEMIVSHMLRAEMYDEAAKLLQDKQFVKARVETMGREQATRQHTTDCEALYDKLKERTDRVKRKKHARNTMERAYKTLGNFLSVGDSACEAEEEQALYVETGRAQYLIGLSLADRRCWNAAILHWETGQDLLVASLGFVEFVAALLLNTGMAYAEVNKYEKALSALKRCLRIRGAVHGEKHILYAQTIQRIGDVFLVMSDYNEAMDSYNWALDVMHIEPNYQRVEIGDVLENMGNIHYSKGEVPEALQCYEDALRSKKVQLGDDHHELAATYQHIGNCLSDQGDIDEAIAHFEEAIRLRKLDPVGGFEQDADILSIEGVLNNLHGKQDQGLYCYEKCLEILVTKVSHKTEKIAALLHLIGCVYLMDGEHKKAMGYFEESLLARQKILGFVHLDVASTLFNMAFLHQMRNRLGKALKCLEEALKIRQLRLPDSEKVALTHEKIGTLSKAVGHVQKAESAFQEALRIRKLVHGDEHEAVAAVLHEMGDLADDMGDSVQAMVYYRQALDIRRKRLGPDHEDVAATLYSMGFTLHNQDESERALLCFEEALNIRKLWLGEDSKEVGDTLNMMGFLRAKRGEMDDALALLWEALRIRKFHEDLVKVCETLKNIGNVHREKREHSMAAECYEECLRIRRAELGDGHEKVADALVAIGNVRSDMEETEKAMEAYKEALTIRTMVHGRNDEKVAVVLQYMGTMEFQTGNFESALRYLDEFVRIRRENQAEQDGEFVNVLFLMGNIHKIEGRDLEAKQCWSEAYQVFQDLGLADENPPELARVVDSLLRGENALYDDVHAVSESEKRGLLNRILQTIRE